ncbi:MBL fold metallo-hydrolase [Rhodococcus sp. BH2-1]|nr:MBL fold metallo-hydrolase [Rhodococcus sp. BH2-1]
MDTEVTEIAADIFRLSTFVDEADLPMNQFLIRGDEPLLFHTGMPMLYPSVSAAVSKLLPLDTLRWITFGHVEADESGSMNRWLAAAPRAQVAHGAMGCFVQIGYLADRPPRPLDDGEVIDVGGRRVRRIETPHVPHGWDAGLMFEETTSTLLCGDFFTAFGRSMSETDHDIVEPALEAEDRGHATALTPALGATLRGLAELEPAVLGLMHGPAYRGACSVALRELAAAYDDRLNAELQRVGR